MSAQPRLRVLEALRHYDFRLLWAGQTVSQIGDAAFVVALGWRAFTLTHKASSLGIVLMVEALGLVATLLIGGVLADRYSRKRLLIEAMTLSAIGGIIGVLVGLGIALLVRNVSPLATATPLWSIVVGLMVSISIGLFFGIYPAMKAATLASAAARRLENMACVHRNSRATTQCG